MMATPTQQAPPANESKVRSKEQFIVHVVEENSKSCERIKKTRHCGTLYTSVHKKNKTFTP